MSVKFCCVHMQQQVGDGLIKYDERFDQFSIVVKAGNEVETLQGISFCPWSGHKLPGSLRSRWFDELEAIGVDPMNDEIPLEYQSAAWRSEAAPE